MSSSVPPPTAKRVAELRENLSSVRAEISEAARAVGLSNEPTLIAVSKLKPASDILAARECGQRDFGENYVQEMVDKAASLPEDVRWHFIGALQSNKCKAIAPIPNLHSIHALDSSKKADLLQKHLSPSRTHPLRVFLQLNTSSESSKSGLSVAPSTRPDLLALAQHIVASCAGLELAGLMTIGSWEASHAEGEENPDFRVLRECRDWLEGELGWGREGRRLELSMGMSADFEEAVRRGSDWVRVGTRIFGERPKKACAGA